MTTQTYTIDLVAICERCSGEDQPTGSKHVCTDIFNRSTTFPLMWKSSP